MYDNSHGCGVDPRNLAQRIMAVCVAVTGLAVLIALLLLKARCLAASLNIVAVHAVDAALLLLLQCKCYHAHCCQAHCFKVTAAAKLMAAMLTAKYTECTGRALLLHAARLAW